MAIPEGCTKPIKASSLQETHDSPKRKVKQTQKVQSRNDVDEKVEVQPYGKGIRPACRRLFFDEPIGKPLTNGIRM